MFNQCYFIAETIDWCGTQNNNDCSADIEQTNWHSIVDALDHVNRNSHDMFTSVTICYQSVCPITHENHCYYMGFDTSWIPDAPLSAFSTKLWTPFIRVNEWTQRHLEDSTGVFMDNPFGPEQPPTQGPYPVSDIVYKFFRECQNSPSFNDMDIDDIPF